MKYIVNCISFYFYVLTRLRPMVFINFIFLIWKKYFEYFEQSTSETIQINKSMKWNFVWCLLRNQRYEANWHEKAQTVFLFPYILHLFEVISCSKSPDVCVLLLADTYTGPD